MLVPQTSKLHPQLNQHNVVYSPLSYAHIKFTFDEHAWYRQTTQEHSTDYSHPKMTTSSQIVLGQSKNEPQDVNCGSTVHAANFAKPRSNHETWETKKSTHLHVMPNLN
jgi:hypothetical protein